MDQESNHTGPSSQESNSKELNKNDPMFEKLMDLMELEQKYLLKGPTILIDEFDPCEMCGS
jgi:hypothetical protein